MTKVMPLAIKSKNTNLTTVQRMLFLDLIAAVREAIRMVESGVASVEDVDTAIVAGLSHPMGPLRLSDLIGLDTMKLIADSMYDEYKDAHYAPPPLLQRMAELADAATTLGIGQEAPAGLDAFMGSIDPADEGVEHAAAMMGQGRVLTSPLAMATVLASVQNGSTVTPRILADEDQAATWVH